MTYEVGKFYNVPCVRGRWHYRLRNWPVMGSVHEDGDTLNFPHLHYHIDWRFVPLQIAAGILEHHYPTGPADKARQHVYAVPLMADGEMNPDGVSAPVLRRRLCRQPHWLPFESFKIPWLTPLENKHAGCRLARGRICPHRGFDLSREPVDEHGIVTCPLHGLRWNAVTGELAPRKAVHSGRTAE